MPFKKKPEPQFISLNLSIYTEGVTHVALTNVLDYDIVESEFELQSNHYVHFWTKTFGKGACRVIGYRRRKWTRRHEFKSWTRVISFLIAVIPLEKVWIQLFFFQVGVNSRADWVLQPWCDN